MRIQGFRLSASPAFKCSGRSELLKIAQCAPRAAQSRSERAQSRSEPPRAFAQSCSRNRPESPRAVQRRPERSLRVAQSTPRAASSEEPLRIARSVPRAAQSRSAVLEKPIGELGVTCTLHIRSQFYFTWFPLLRACIPRGQYTW